MNIAIVSLFDENMAGIAEISCPNFHEYGARWRHDVLIHQRVLHEQRHPSWSKIPALILALETKRYDWAFWVDCDTLFMNHNVSLESKIAIGRSVFRRQKGRSQDDLVEPAVIFASDFNGISCCSMFVRNCHFSRKFLRTVNLCGELTINDPDGHGNKWEQNTIKHLLANFPEIREFMAALPQEETNYHFHASNFPVGGFLLHFPVMPVLERVEAMNKMSRFVMR